MSTFYGQRSDGGYASYDGMSQDVITSMLSAQGLTITWMDEATWSAAMQALQQQMQSNAEDRLVALSHELKAANTQISSLTQQLNSLQAQVQTYAPQKRNNTNPNKRTI